MFRALRKISKWRQVGSREREQEMQRKTLVRQENSMKFRMAGREDDNHGKAQLARALNTRLCNCGLSF